MFSDAALTQSGGVALNVAGIQSQPGFYPEACNHRGSGIAGNGDCDMAARGSARGAH